PQYLPADVSAKRLRPLADRGGPEPDDPDGDAQRQCGTLRPASRPREALQDPADVLLHGFDRLDDHAWRVGRPHGRADLAGAAVPARRGLRADAVNGHRLDAERGRAP